MIQVHSCRLSLSRLRWPGRVASLLLLVVGSSAQSTVGDVSGEYGIQVVRRADAAECILLGIRELESALASAGTRTPLKTGPSKIVVESIQEPALNPQRSTYETAVPASAESFAIHRTENEILVLGRDAVGAMYGAFEVAEVVRRTGSVAAVADAVQQPFLAFRGVNQFLHEEALQDPNSWFYQEAFWEGYFALLARSRHNVLDLHAGYGLVQTNFPNIFPYFISLDEFPGQCVGRAAAARNLAMLNRIIGIGKRHGVNVALMNYTVQGRKNEARGELFAGFNGPRLAHYTFLASRALLRACPDLWMYGFRIGESGQPEDFFQKTYLAAVADSGFRGKLFTRSWLAIRKNVETIKQGFPGDFYIEVKYNGEQLGLPYQAITSPTRFDPSYSYEAYTNEPRGFKLVYQVRANGTLRIFHWGDPDYVARIVRSCRLLGDAAGYSVEPMTAYYPMTDRYHPADGHHYFQWTWQRDWFWYELWGRLAYDPGLAPGVFSAMFEQRFGKAGESLFPLVATASQVVPLIMSAITLGPDHRQWAPEFETGNPDFTNLNGRRSFGNIEGALDVSSLDPTVMSSIADAAAAEIADRSDGRVDPRTTAGRLFSIATRIDELLGKTPPASANADEAECMRLDAEALASLARFAGERSLAALNLAEYRLTSFPRSLSSARHHLLWAREHWRHLAEVADRHYAPLLESLRIHTQAYRWESQLPVLDGDLAHLTEIEQAWDARQPAKIAKPLAHLPGRGAQVERFLPEDAAWPVQWRGSGFESVSVDGRAALRSRDGCIAFDVDDLMLSNVDADLAIEVPYWDPDPGANRRLLVAYDGVARPSGTLVEAGTIALGGSRGWHRARLALNHARLAGGGPGNSDIAISSSDGEEFVVQSPSIQVVRAPNPHLDLHIAGALKRTPSKPSIHWRVPGGPWKVAALRPGIGEPGIEGGTVPRGREIYRFDIPQDVEAIEYYFTAEWAADKRRLPAGDTVFKWRRPHEAAPLSIVSEAIESPGHDSTFEIQARVSSPDGVARVVAYFKPIPTDKQWQSVGMKEIADGVYSASVPLTAEGLLYRFQATDKLGHAVLYPDFECETPYRIIPSWNPSLRSEEQTK